jgi:hypothetical protein
MVIQCVDHFRGWGVGWAPLSEVNGEGRRCGGHFGRGEDLAWWPAADVTGDGAARKLGGSGGGFVKSWG